jgi:hypothetical protein
VHGGAGAATATEITHCPSSFYSTWQGQRRTTLWRTDHKLITETAQSSVAVHLLLRHDACEPHVSDATSGEHYYWYSPSSSRMGFSSSM